MAQNQCKGEMFYEEQCQRLKWFNLFDHRTQLSLVECYKLVFGYYHLNFEDFLGFTTSNLQEQIILINIMSNKQD